MKYCTILYFVLCIVSCSVTTKIKDGETAFERKQYAIAVNFLEKEYEENNQSAQKGRKAYLLGTSYRFLQEYEKAYDWQKKAVSHNYGTESMVALAEAAKSLQQYDEAIDLYKKLRTSTGLRQEFDREILITEQSKRSLLKPQEYRVDKFFENSPNADFSPVIFDKDYLVFSSDRQDATGKANYNWTGQKFSDIFISLKTGGEAKRFDASINTAKNEGTPWFSRDMENLYFTRCYSFTTEDEKCKIMHSKRIHGIWEEPKVLPFIKDNINYGQPTLIENDSVLVFSADIGNVGGTKDLYYTELFNDGTWSEPEMLPSSINSQGNEKFPTGDADTLYFSSDYLQGQGGFDIFKTFLRSDGSWTAPINMGPDINTGGDEFSFIVDYHGKPQAGVLQQGYFSSSRLDTGKDDIFRFKKLGQRETTPIKDTIPTKEIAAPTPKSLFLIVKTLTPQFTEENNPNSAVIGKTVITNALVRIIDDKGRQIVEARTDQNGSHFLPIELNKQYTIYAFKAGYLTASVQVDTRNIIFEENKDSKTINAEALLAKIYEDIEININNIYYDLDKWDIRPDAQPPLNELAEILKNNPRVNIQLSSHTDCRATDEYNMELSQKRAQSAMNYLISKGIARNRLTAQGYGESVLIDRCNCEDCTEDQHQKNRRTTFMILGKSKQE